MRLLFTLLIALAFAGTAVAAQVPETPLLTGPNFQQVPASDILVQPTGGTLTTLGDALSTSSGNLSAGRVTSTGSSITKTLADWTFYISLPNSTGATQMLGPDGALNAVVGWVPATASPIETPTLLPGITGAGATFACLSTSSPSVGCNLVGQGAGNTFFGNGSGSLLGLLDPGDVVSVYYTMTPGITTAGRPNTYYLRPVMSQGVTVANFNIITAGGFGAGVSAIAQGAGCTSLGFNTQCQGLNTLVSGNLAYDFTGQGVRVHSSYPTAGATGGNQIMEQTLQHTFTNTAGGSRLVMDGGSGVSHTTTVPMEPLAHGIWYADVECSATASGGTVTAGDTQAWTAKGTFTKISGTLTFPVGSGTATALVGSGTLSGATLAITADTTNNNMSVLVTPPAGNTGTIGCTAYVRWLQRLS